MDSLPFFYYDILARIVPGAATLAVVWDNKIAFHLPVAWLMKFANADGDWRKVVVPVALLGLSYVIGVVYEVADYFPDFSFSDWFRRLRAKEHEKTMGRLDRVTYGMKALSQWTDDCAFD